MPKFVVKGAYRVVFPRIRRPNGSTLEASPGEVVVLSADPRHPLLDPVPDPEKTIGQKTPSSPDKEK